MNRRRPAILAAAVLIAVLNPSSAQAIKVDITLGSSYWNDSPQYVDWREEYFFSWSASSKISLFFPLSEKIDGGVGLRYSRWWVDKPTDVSSTVEPLSGKKELYEILAAARLYIYQDDWERGRMKFFFQLGTSLYFENSAITMEYFNPVYISQGRGKGIYQRESWGVNFGIGGEREIKRNLSFIFLSRIHHIYNDRYPKAVFTFGLGIVIHPG
ncbi:MAG: hypothetical protein JXB45_07825 [Candidatus Krumholzibacteriota bacterium]|nr:hypothetical protein [Candidatus Krumholzibacteriota bacterium]